MGSKSVVALLFSLNLLFFSMVSCCNTPKCPSPPAPIKCPGLRVCANILLPPFKPDHNCCPLIAGLVDLEAAVCLCAVLKINVGGIVSVNLDLLIEKFLDETWMTRRVPIDVREETQHQNSKGI
ncbi:unnamed protein product [Sphenostylis stenocarpa]|uniref:Hydrophobic seed protein domain-containing protein n=1 Tax=Sphenostylis stenocarpa TaxID=92480 RepID=A0AA86SX14_9FABA|nr:unnamed protein product [Sphenostylis stenocarpa]